MTADMDTSMASGEPLLRLLQLVSPTLPTGAFSYSQGLEWAVEAGWVHDGPTLYDWLNDLAEQSMTFVDIPILHRLYGAIKNDQFSKVEEYCCLLLACRETAELRREEQTRGRAMATLLQDLAISGAKRRFQLVRQSQLVGFALAAVRWQIPLRDAALAYSWSWLENQIIAGVKIIPLGQTEGQRLLLQLGAVLARTVDQGLTIRDEEIGSASPALSLASSLHETQYTRLYRS